MGQRGNKAYHIVEFRFPFEIDNAKDAQDAAYQASKLCEKEFGFFPSSWYARVFEYGSLEDGVGVIAEYFSTPSGSSMRKVDQNIERHEKLIKEGFDE